MEVASSMVKELRERSGCGIMDCKRALLESKGDVEGALKVLRESGLAKAAKKTGRKTAEGLVASYIHTGGKIGVLVEVGCETDFVARTEEFKQFVKDITMQVAATNPDYIKREDVPEEVIEKEKEIYASQFRDKPEKAREGIIKGKLEKFFQEVCLLEQPFVKETSKTVKEHLTAQIAQLGEQMEVKRFVRYCVGEE